MLRTHYKQLLEYESRATEIAQGDAFEFLCARFQKTVK